MISIIAAYDNNQGIGIDNQLPWILKDDMRNFKKITENEYVIMGRKTFDSIGHPLPKRKNFILTRQEGYKQTNCTILHDLSEAIQVSNNNPKKSIFIIGGGEIYRMLLKYSHYLYITQVDTVTKSDTFFPRWKKSSFKIIQYRNYKKNNENEYDFSFQVWKRKS